MLFDGLFPVHTQGADREPVVGLCVALDANGVLTLSKGSARDPIDPVLPAFGRWDVEPRERFAVDVDFVAVFSHLERLHADVGVDRRLGGHPEGVFGRTVADEVGPRDVEFSSVLAEVFLDIDERVVRAGSIGHVE